MVRVNLKGIAKVTAKGRTYWYAWRGGPRLRGEPGSPEFVASYSEAIESLRTPDTRTASGLGGADYKASGEYKKLAESTQRAMGVLARPHRRTTSASCKSLSSIARRKFGQ